MIPSRSALVFALCTTACIALSTIACTTSRSAESIGWHNHVDGRYPEADPPLHWSPELNVAWKTAMPSWSNASPVLLSEADLIFVRSEPDRLLAVERASGRIAWERSVGDVDTGPTVNTHETNGYTSPTPVTDGVNVYTVFGTGVVAAHGLDGERRWARQVGRPDLTWGYSASPALGGGHLIVHVGDVMALDPATGREVWRAPSAVKYGSPVVTQVGGTDVVIAPAGDVFLAADGTQLATGIGSLEFATPVVQDGIVYFIEKRATAVRLPQALGETFAVEPLWEARIQGSRHYASPLIHDGLLYAISREEKFTILDAATGDIVLEKELDLGEGGNSAYASITLAGDRIFIGAETGTTVVLEPGRTYEEIARNDVGRWRSTPVFAGDRMYVRAYDYLYCFVTN